MSRRVATARSSAAPIRIAQSPNRDHPHNTPRTASDRKPAGRISSSPFRHVLVLVSVVVAVLAGVTLFGLGGLHYYLTPPAARGAQKAHRILRPSGTVGLVFGIAGAGLMLLTLPYVLRKKVPSLVRRGSTQRWLDFHVFCGIVGPVLITLHTSFKFNGVVSVAYWSMVLVVLSGFVGRYLYVRIPRSIRGTELSLGEIHEKIDDLKSRAEKAAFQAGSWHAMDAEVAALDAERALLVRRMANLGRTKKLFALWHVFHKPLVYIMFAIAAVHIALAVYLGYSLHF